MGAGSTRGKATSVISDICSMNCVLKKYCHELLPMHAMAKLLRHSFITGLCARFSSRLLHHIVDKPHEVPARPFSLYNLYLLVHLLGSMDI